MLTLGVDPGLSHYAYVIVDEGKAGRLPQVLGKATINLRKAASATDAAYELVAGLCRSLPIGLAGVEDFAYRPWQRGVNLSVVGDMAAVVEATRRACLNAKVPVFLIDPKAHKALNVVPLAPKQCSNAHLRDAYSIALFAQGESRLRDVPVTPVV